jgi:hypothetical protein
LRIQNIPFIATDWSTVPGVVHVGQTGRALWRTRQFGDIRVRMVDYSPGYVADHWCGKGHILLCMGGELITELEDGRRVILGPGMSYQVADGHERHRSHAPNGATLFIVD